MNKIRSNVIATTRVGIVSTGTYHAYAPLSFDNLEMHPDAAGPLSLKQRIPRGAACEMILTPLHRPQIILLLYLNHRLSLKHKT
jgi:hypothetical protein